MDIPFNRPFLSGREQNYLAQAVSETQKFSGDGPFTRKASTLLESDLGSGKVLLTTSCTHAMEMAALLFDVQPGDEVIVPSYTFVSTANAFVLRGAQIVWVDIDPDTMNLNVESVLKAITKKTKVIVPVQYGGFSCDMDAILQIARERNIWVLEDAAQSIGASYKGKKLGTLGDLGAFSFHETKNLHCGEGGALVINNPALEARAEIIREKGTNRSRYFRGEVDKYTWVDIGSSYLPSELNAAFLLAQLEERNRVSAYRKEIWDRYYARLSGLSKFRSMQKAPWNVYNGHLFYVLTNSEEQTGQLISYLKSRRIHAVFHYIPLHSSPYGVKVGRAGGSLAQTDTWAPRLVRLPFFYSMTLDQVEQVAEAVRDFFDAA